MSTDLHEDRLDRILIEPAAIQNRVIDLGRRISEDYALQQGPLVLIGILKGSIYFLADLSRSISVPVEIELMSISSYGSSTKASGVVRILKDLDISITNRHVLIIEGLIDTGLTLGYLRRSLLARRPESLRICALLDKPARRAVDVHIDYIGFTIPDEFVVGYGLDFDQRYRNLPFVGALRSAALELSR